MGKNEKEDLGGLCKWLREKKGIKKIDIMKLVDYIPEYENWLVENKKEWVSSLIKCDLCGYSWTAVYHIESKRLECPNCNNMTII